MIRYIEGSLYRGSFLYISYTLHYYWAEKYSPLYPSLYKGALNRGCAVFQCVSLVGRTKDICYSKARAGSVHQLQVSI